MQNITITNLESIREKAIATAPPLNPHSTTKIALAFGCLFAGFAAPFVGLIFLVFHEMFNDGLLNSIGTVLMIVSIPLILLGSVFMDSVEKSD